MIPYLLLFTGIFVLFILAIVELLSELGWSVQIITGRDYED